MKKILLLFVLVASIFTSSFAQVKEIINEKPQPPKIVKDASVIFIWEGIGNVKIEIDKKEHFLKNNTPYTIELKSQVGYEFSLLKPGKKYFYNDFLIFKKGTDTVYVNFTGQGDQSQVLAESPAQRNARLNGEKPVTAPVISKNIARVSFIWEGADNIKMLLNRESYFLTRNTPKDLELQPGEGYLLKLETPGKTYEYPKFLVFEAGADTAFIQLSREMVKMETAAGRVETRRKMAEILNEIQRNMVKVEGGTFTMGCTTEQLANCGDNEKPAHAVTLNSFYMAKYEVTVAQFEIFINETAYQTDADREGWSYAYTGSSWEKNEGVNWRCGVGGSERSLGEYNHPVIHVSWNDAVAYCNWLSSKTGKKYRLPTEAEWEFAARGGNSSPSGGRSGGGLDYLYSGSNNIDEVAWYTNNSGNQTHAVGQKKANKLGICDMSGNVWEWCSDWYSDSYYQPSPANNPKGPTSGSYRVVRGGSWSDDAAYCRSASRDYDAPGNRGHSGGFRLSQDF